jgi:hypothetical protein
VPEPDPLVSNGLGSPSCSDALIGRLSGPSRRDCEVSGFVAAPAPTADYGVDIHIDTGSVLSTSSDGLLSVIQNVVMTPVWLVLVWVVHALLVMLDWSFSIELLGGRAASEAAGDLLREEAGVSGPWLPFALAVAGGLAAYDGLVRRRVAQTFGEALLTTAMIALGLWIVGDPGGTVGALGGWSSQASVGAVSVATGASPSAGQETFGNSLARLFAVAIEGPWCYLEFGDVSWCQRTSRLDPRLRAAALRIAGEELAESACRNPGDACRGSGSAAIALQHEASLLRGASTNGEIFLALPANGPTRNSINSATSLYRALCESSDATSCKGPAAAEAEFRTGSGTWSRLGGLVLIGFGLLGMLLLLGFVALRLLTAATQGLLFLLMAPAMVLAPAFGSHGRSLFSRWAKRLLAAVVSKLLYAFLLGLLFTVTAILIRSEALGWWTEWLLLSAFWWTVYLRRHELLTSPVAASAARAHPRRSIPGRIITSAARSGSRIAFTRLLIRHDEAVASGLASAQLKRPKRAPAARPMPARSGAADVMRLLDQDAASSRSGDAARHSSVETDRLRSQLVRVESARISAIAAGDKRRGALLASRKARIEAELDEHSRRGTVAAEAARRSRTVRSLRVRLPSEAAVQERDRFLDFQAAMPDALHVRSTGPMRNYAALAPLVERSEGEYEGLDEPSRRRARLAIDRELRERRAIVLDRHPPLEVPRPVALPQPDAPVQRPRRRRPRKPAGERGPLPPLDKRTSESAVMRDLWAVAAGHKRHFGIGRD